MKQLVKHYKSFENMLKLVETPISSYSGALGSWQKIYLKDETKQLTGAFKIRGVNHFFKLKKPINGVVTASTGNHGLAVATCANFYNLPSVIFLPKFTNQCKIDRFNTLDTTLNFVEASFDECLIQAKEFALKNDYCFIHSFEESEILEGHESMFREIDAHGVAFDTVFIPVGGGGLLAACLNHYQGKNIRVVGVEYEGAPALKTSLSKSKIITLEEISGKAEGLLVKKIGEKAFRIASERNVDIILISEDEMMQSMNMLQKYNGINAEYAGAAGLAAALSYNEPNKTALAIISGGNYYNNSTY